MFVLHQGMSGTGKTTALMDMVLQQNKRVIYLVPDQMSVHTERYVTSRVKNKATINVYVYTFKLLEKQILKQSQNQVYTELGIIEQFLILLRILEQEEDTLKALRYMKNNSDQIEECLELFSLWRNQRIDVDTLDDFVEDGKLKELFMLYRHFMNAQKQGMYFPEEIYRLASSSLVETDFFANTIIVIDGFYLFSETEKVMIQHMLMQAEEVHMTLPCYMNGSMPEPLIQTKQELLQFATQLNHQVQVQEYTTLVRQKNKTQLQSLVKNLPNINIDTPHSDNSIQCIQAETIDAEIHEIASQIRESVMLGEAMYSDCVLYIANMSEYRDKIATIFQMYDIPVFLDAKEDIKYTALAQLIRMLTDLFVSRINGNNLIALLKTGFFMELSEVYELEPVLRMFTLNDASGFKREKWDMYTQQCTDKEIWTSRFNQLQAVVDTLIGWKQVFSKKRQFGQKLHILFECMNDFQLFEQLNDCVDQHVLQMFSDRIDELFNLFETQKMSNRMFEVVMRMVVDQLTYMKQPSSQNQVIIADFTRSRISQNMQLSGALGVKQVYIPSFIQGAIPPLKSTFTLVRSEDLIQEELKQLIPSEKQEYGLRFMYVYFAFAQASERLTLSYPKRSRENSENVVHRIFEMLRASSQAKVKKATSIEEPRVPTTHLLKEEALLFSAFLEKKDPFAYTSDEMKKIILDTAEVTYSVSQFERYNSCPFQYFLERKVRLSEGPQSFTDSRTIGNIVHDFMESVASQSYNTIENENAGLLADQFLTRYENEKLGFSFAKESAYTQLLRQKICTHLEDNFNRYRYFRQHAAFVPYATEAIFHFSLNGKKIRGKIDRIDVATYDNKTFFQVIDYKSSPKMFDWSRFSAGIQLQLPFYINAQVGLQKHLPDDAIPSGFYYQTLKVDDDKYQKESIHLDGYTLNEPVLIQSVIDDLNMYNGIRIKKDGTFGSHAKVLTEVEFNALKQQTEMIVETTINRIESNVFDVEPLAFIEKGRVHEPEGCQYCRFQGICQRELIQKEQFRKVEKSGQEDIL